jgi:phosphatidylglycerol:prolipoprotein diacylglycerol transferase
MVAFYLPGRIPVYAYSIFLALGACLGLAWIARRSSPKLALRQVEAGMWALLGGLIGSRAVFVAASWPYFQDHILESLQFYRGGLGWPGALAGGLLALAAYATFNRIPLAGLVEDMLPLLAAISVSAWLGCWASGCAYGIASDAWWSLPSADEWGVIANRLPVQILGALFTVALFALVDLLAAGVELKPGYRAILSMLGLSLILLATAFLRGDPARLWNGLRLDALAALIYSLLALVSLAVYHYLQLRGNHPKLEDYPIDGEANHR